MAIPPWTISAPPKIPAPLPVEPKVIADLEQLFFNQFIKCMVDHDLSVLVVSGIPEPHHVAEAWLSLQSQFYELINSKEAGNYVKNGSKMEQLNTKITLVSETVDCMRKLIPLEQWDDIARLAACMKEWGFKKAYSKETIEKDLASVSRELSNSRLKLAQLRQKHELEEENKDKNLKSSKKEDWVKTLHGIEAHKKMVFERAKLNMYDFALYIKELQEYNALITSQNRNNGRR